MRLEIVIVNYKMAELTLRCLQSLQREIEGESGISITVVDNHSEDDVVSLINTSINDNAFREQINFIELPKNGGFAYGNNAAIGQVLQHPNPPDFILLLNPDTFVFSGAIQTLLSFMSDNPSVGIAGGRLEEENASVQRSAFRFHSFWSELENGLQLGVVSRLLNHKVVAPPAPNQAVETDWVMGAMMMIRREVFEAIGPLDEAFFMYFEEVDFCLRAKRAGWLTWYVPESRVQHLGGKVSENNALSSPARPSYWFHSRRHYFTKNHGVFYAMVADLSWILGHLIWKLRAMIQNKTDQNPRNILKDFLKNSVVIKGRRCEVRG